MCFDSHTNDPQGSLSRDSCEELHVTLTQILILSLLANKVISLRPQHQLFRPCGMRDLLQPGTESLSPALGAQSLNH